VNHLVIECPSGNALSSCDDVVDAAENCSNLAHVAHSNSANWWD
jgi:hypothetical protein